MAKKKSGKSSGSKQPKAMSPEQYMREKARQLPLYKCYVNPDWQERGMANVFVSRSRKDGKIAYALFLVDTFCMGVKDVAYNSRATTEEFDELIDDYQHKLGLEEIDYDFAHNLIYGAIGFAEDAGIKPHRDFGIARYILEEDTDDVPLIEIEFGKNGRHYLMPGPFDNARLLYNTLKRNLGDNFDYAGALMDDDDDYDDDEYDDDYDDDDADDPYDWGQILRNFEDRMKESKRHPKEVYNYVRPEYPRELNLKHQFIGKELLSETNKKTLPKKVIDRILALPADEVAADLSQLILYEIGRTWQDIEDDTCDEWSESALLHATVLLAELRRPEGLEGLTELLRQSDEFMDYNFGDIPAEVLPVALYACARDNVEAIEALLNQPGLESFNRASVFESLAWIIAQQPERRSEIIEVMRRKLKAMVADLPEQRACDGAFAGLMMCDLIHIGARELVPEIKAVYATDCVDKTIAGTAQDVIKAIERLPLKVDTNRYKYPDVYERFSWIGSF